MDIENEIISYLHEYGNTRESDVIKYGKTIFKYTNTGMKKAISRMLKKGIIYRIIHTKLKPPAVYLSVKEHLPLEIEKELIRAHTEITKAELYTYAHGERL